MVTQALFIVSVVSMVLVTISTLFFPTYPVIVLYSLAVALIAIAFYAPIKKNAYGIFFACLLVIIVHGIYFLPLSSSLFLACFLIGLIGAAVSFYEPQRNWLLMSLVLQLNWLPEMLINLLMGSYFHTSLLLVLDVVMLFYESIFTIFWLMDHKHSVIWFFAQFVPVLNTIATAYLYFSSRSKKKEEEDVKKGPSKEKPSGKKKPVLKESAS